jgi:pimeloyl-ACP methyl ester carboxylesterase
VLEPHRRESTVVAVPYAERDGTRLWYEELGSGAPVVCLHEGVTDGRVWLPFARVVATTHRVVVLDRRGYGRSDRWDGPFAPADDVVCVLAEIGVERASVVGGSAGGAVALATALEHPDRVEKVVVCASHAPGQPVEIEAPAELEARWEDAVARRDYDAMAEVDLATWAPLGADDELRSVFRENAEASFAEDEEEPKRWPESPVIERLGEIRAPVLVVTGGRDQSGFERAADELVAGLPNARRARIADADHLVAWRRPDELARLVREFLAG